MSFEYVLVNYVVNVLQVINNYNSAEWHSVRLINRSGFSAALEEYPHNISVETTFNTAKVSWLPPYVNDSQLYRYELW